MGWASAPVPWYCVSQTALRHSSPWQRPFIGPVPQRKRNADVYSCCLYQPMIRSMTSSWCYELRSDLFERRTVFKVFLCPDIGTAFRRWKGDFLSSWAWLRKNWRLREEVYPVSQFVNQKLRSVGCPSSARKKRVLDVEMGYMGYTKTRKS